MHVNDVEINGYLIEEFNQYGLEVGKTQGTCPLCSHDRKPDTGSKNVLLMIGNGSRNVPQLQSNISAAYVPA